MGRPTSLDLRERMVRGLVSGGTCRTVGERLDVAPSTAVKVRARFEATGSFAPAALGRPEGSGKLAPYRAMIIEKVKQQPDITMPSLAVWLEETHGVCVDPSNLSKLLCKAGFSYKKNTAGGGKRTQRREGGPD